MSSPADRCSEIVMARRSWILAALIPILGCGGASQTNSSPEAADGFAAKRAPQAGAPEAAPAKGGKPAADDVPIERKIIYSAAVEVVVKNLEETVPSVEKLVTDLKGY